MFNHPFSLWLLPPLLLSAYSLWCQGKRTFEWSWGYSLQATIIFALSVSGFIFGLPLFWACAAWAAIFLFWGMPRMVVSQLESCIVALDAERTERLAQRMPTLYWGKVGSFWKDMMIAIALFMRSDEERATAILDKWDAVAPAELKLYIDSYRRLGNAILWHWQKIIDNYESALVEYNGKVPSTFRVSASRAYAEIGDIESATRCLEQAKLEEARYNPKELAQILLPFFCIAGDLAHVERILKQVSKGKNSLPEYARLYWLGRCLIARGEIVPAKSAFEKALHLAQSHNRGNFDLWQKRIQHLLYETDNSDYAPPIWAQQDDRIWRILQRVAYIQSVISPNRHSYVVAGLCVAIILMHLLSNLYYYFPYSENEQLRIHMYMLGILDPKKVLQGEYWRLITWLFLHKDEVHCFVNVFGLYWFGRIAQNIFGTTRFIFIFFLTGMLSGVAQTILDFGEQAAGASGAVMGVFGAAGAGIFRMKRYLPRKIWQLELGWLGALALASTISDQMIPHVASFAHLGGLIAGVMFGLIVKVPRPAYAVKGKSRGNEAHGSAIAHTDM